MASTQNTATEFTDGAGIYSRRTCARRRLASISTNRRACPDEPGHTAIVCTILGSGTLTTLVTWLLRHINPCSNLEQGITDSATIHQIELDIYRQSPFLPTTNRMQHEHQLDAGKAYMECGSNGAGHARYQQKNDDYRHWLATDDWNYHPSRNLHN